MRRLDIAVVITALTPVIAIAQFDGNNVVPLLAAAAPRCTVVATPNSPAVVSTVTLAATCTRNPTTYVWNGPNIAPGTVTTSNTLSLLTPSTSGPYTYGVSGKKGNLPGPVASAVVNVAPNQSPHVSFSLAPTGVSTVGAPATFSVQADSGDGANQAISVAWYLGLDGPVATGNTFNWLPGREGVYNVRAVVTDAANATASVSQLRAVAVAPNAAVLPPPSATAAVGTIAGSFGVSDSGAAGYSVPIRIPPGSAGLEPNLALSYSSQAGNGLLGVGWNLSGLSVVTRCAKTYATDNVKIPINYDGNPSDTAYCLDGDRLIEVGQTPLAPTCGQSPHIVREYRTERETYARIRSVEDGCAVAGPSRFEVYTKAGQIMHFGLRWLVLNDGPVFTPSRAAKVWPLDKVMDRAGNYFVVEYGGNQNVMRNCAPAGLNAPAGAYPPTEFYPTWIFYTRNDAQDPPLNSQIQVTKRAIQFLYAARPVEDTHVFYDSAASQSQLTQALSGIVTYADATVTITPPGVCTTEAGYAFNSGTSTKTYTLSYTPSAATKRTLLWQLTETGSDGVSLAPTTFSYKVAASTQLTPSTASGFPSSNTLWQAADVDGDGKTDLVQGLGVAGAIQTCLSTSNWNCAFYWPIVDENNQPPSTASGFQLADINGDGLADVVYYTQDPQNQTQLVAWVCYAQPSTPVFRNCITKTSSALPLVGNAHNWADPHFAIDLDGDGHNDLLFYDGAASDVAHWHAYLNNGSSFGNRIDFAFSILGTSGTLAQRQVLAGDFDGDGKTDLLIRKDDGEISPTPQWKVCFSRIASDGSGQFDCKDWADGPEKRISNVVVADFNGDGLADITSTTQNDPGASALTREWRVCLSVGNGSFACNLMQSVNADVNSAGFAHFALGDFNGDGQTDMIRHVEPVNFGDPLDRWQVCYSMGGSVTASPNLVGNTALSFRCETLSLGPNKDAGEVFYGDFMGSGRTDFSWGTAIYSNLPVGDRVQRDLMWDIHNGLGADTQITYLPLTDNAAYSKTATFDQPPATISPATNELLIQSPLWVVSRQDASTSVASSPFYSTAYRYAGLKAMTNGRGVMGFAQREVVEGTTNAGVCTANTTGVNCIRTLTTYTTFTQSYPLSGRVSHVQKYVAPTTGTPNQLVNDVTNIWQSRDSLQFPYHPPPATQPRIYEVFLTAKTEASWEPSSGASLPNVTTTNPIGQWDAYGNALQVIVSTTDGFSKNTINTFWEDSDPSYATNWILGRLNTTTVSSTLPDGSSTLPNGASATRKVAFTYNAPTGPQPGLLASETIEPDKPNTGIAADKVLWQKTSYTYDGWANRQQTTVQFYDDPNAGTPRTRSSTVVFASSGRFPQTLTNAAGHIETRSYDSRFGLISESISPNGIITDTNYDGFGRKIFEAIKGPGGSPVLAQRSWTWALASAPNAYRITGTSSDGAVDTVEYDQLERHVKNTTRIFDTLFTGGIDVSTTTAYDALGRKQSVTRPVAQANGASATRQTVWTYDNLSRPTGEIDYRPDGTMYRTSGIAYGVDTFVDTFAGAPAYPRAKVTTTRDPNTPDNNINSATREVETKWSNSQGQVIRVQDALNSQTNYAFDAIGNLQCVSPAGVLGGQRCTISGRSGLQVATLNDLRGRKIEMSDPDSGHWQYTYSGVGELMSQLDGRSLLTTFSYDALGRPSTRNESGFSTSWTYDLPSCPNGKLCSQNASDGVSQANRAYFYDAYVRPYRTRTTIISSGVATEVHDAHTLYDSLGHVRIVAYPISGPNRHPAQLRHSYIGSSSFTSAIDEWDPRDGIIAPSITTHWSSPYRYQDGQLWQQTLGVGSLAGAAVSSRDYDEMGRIKAIRAGTTNNVENASYTFDRLGNLMSRSDAAVPGLVPESFGYDLLNRLSTVSGAASKNFRYDPVGNLVCRSDLPPFPACPNTPNTNLTYVANTHQLANVGSSPSWTWQWTNYDLNGNVRTVTSAPNSLTKSLNYNAFNLPISMSVTGAAPATLAYIYDGDHARVRETVTGTSTSPTTTMIGNTFFEKVTDTAGTRNKHYLAGPDGIFGVLTRDTGVTTVTYWHKDHLGSVMAEVNGTTGSIQRLSYDAWGQRRQTNGQNGVPTQTQLAAFSSQRGFTGHEMLDEIGLVHMNGRVYDPNIGRFLQADPIVQDPFGLQSYNRYAYVLNNPLSLTDPTGYLWKGFLGKFVFPSEYWGWRLRGNEYARAVGAIVAAYYTMGAASGLALSEGASAAQASAIGAAAGGFAAGGIQGGNIQSALYGALGGLAFYGAGSLAGEFGEAQFAAGVGFHAAVGCGTSALQGGSCRSGAMAAGFAEFAGPIGADQGYVFGTTKAMIVGGVGSVLGGGKFANGAVTGAFGYLFNECAHDACKRFLKQRGFETVSSESGGVQTTVDYSDRAVLRPTTSSPREVWSGTVDNWLDVDVSPLVQRITQMPIDLKFGMGTEFGTRLYQYEQGLSIYQQNFVGGQLVSERPVGSVWGLGYAWRANPMDAGPISRTRFHTCTFADVCVGGP